MRKLKWNGFSLFSALFLALFATIFSFLLTENASAVEINGSGFSRATSATIYFSDGTVNSSAANDNLVEFIFGSGAVRQVTSIQYCLSSTIPANSIFTISAGYRNFGASVTFSDFGPAKVLSNESNSTQGVTAMFYTSVPISGCAYAHFRDLIVPQNNNLYFSLSKISWVQLASGVTADQLAGIELNLANRLETLNQDLKKLEQSIAGIDLSNLGQIADNQQQLITNQQQTTDAVNNMSEKLDNQTQQDKDQYDQEKQEEQDRENQGNEDADQMAGLFDFTFVNPFYFLAAGFTPGNTCVSIPTIAGMLNTDQTTFCPFFSQETRNIVTPVLTLFAMVILFGFLVSWLGGGGFNSVVNTSNYGQGRLFK